VGHGTSVSVFLPRAAQEAVEKQSSPILPVAPGKGRITDR
jgi:hypothetical protein